MTVGVGKFKIFLLAVLFALCAGEPLIAARLPVRIYTSADGLGSSFVDCIYRDSRSFMWFCTRDGLSRFDGARFVTYQVGERDAPPGIEAIRETRDGTYWIATTGGVYRFRPDRVSTPTAVEARLDAEFVSTDGGAFYEDRGGTLWLFANGLSRLRTAGEKAFFEKFDLGIPPVPKKPFYVIGMDETADGSLWVATSWGLVRRLSDSRTILYPFEIPFSAGNASLMADRNGRIWLTLKDQLLIINPEPPGAFDNSPPFVRKSAAPTARFALKLGETAPLPEKPGEIVQFSGADFIDKSPVIRLFETSDGTVWLTGGSNLLEFRDNVFRVHTRAEGLPNELQRMGEDAAGNLWIGGFAGLTRLDRRGLVTYGTADGAAAENFAAINEDADGALYFAASDFSLSRFDGSRLQTVRPSLAPDAATIWTSRYAFRASNGDWWLLTEDRLYRFAGVADFASLDRRAPSKIYTSADGLKSDGVFQIFESSNGDLWVSTRGESGSVPGLSVLKKGAEKFYAFSETDGYPPNKSPSSFAEDRRGNIWFGFYQGGLARYDGKNFEVFDEADGIPSRGLISDLHVDARGRLWLSSSIQGLLRIDDPGAKSPALVYITTGEGLASNNVRTLTEDRFGRIYAGTASGVDRLSPDTGRVKHYSVNDGLAADFVVDSHADKHGNLWFATSSGVSRLIPVNDENPAPPQVYIGGLRIAGVEQPISQLGSGELRKPDLAPTDNNFQIDFFGLDFRAGETLRYQYKLEGADADWSQPTEQRTVTLANLQPAEYRFLVRAVNSEGAASERPAIVSFEILPPVWARWWFILLAALLVSATIVLLYRYRISHLQAVNRALTEANRAEEALRRSKEERLAELEEVRTRIATDLHDDIGASLTQIAILSEVARQQKNAPKTDGNRIEREPLTMIYDVSTELVGTMSDIVWAINPKKDHLEDLTLRMRRFASDVLSPKDIDFEMNAPEDETEISLGSALRRELFLIFKESINNIVKHSGATEVMIDFVFSEPEVFLTVRDNGRGFDLAKFTENATASLFADYRGGNGLLSMKRRAAELGGELEISSPPGGTTVKLRLPLHKN